MKNKVVRNFAIFVAAWLVFTVVLNVRSHRAILANFPWEVLLMLLLALILVVTNLSKRVIYGIYFVVFFIYMCIRGGYYGLPSLLVFAIMAALMSLVTYFIGTQFRKGNNISK